MKRTAIAAALLLSLALPLGASAAQPLDKSENARQRIMNLEYELNQPGLPAAQSQAVQNEIVTIEQNLLTSDTPAIPVPVFGGCDADRSLLAYLQDQVQNGNLTWEDQYSYNRNIHDIGVNLKQLGC